MIVPVADAADPRLAEFVAIRERDLVGRQGRFIAEGEVVVRVLLQRSKYRTTALLAADKLVERIAPLVPDDIPIYSAPIALISEVAGFHIHRGLLAVGERPSPPTLESLLPSARRVVVLCGLTNHDNVGGIFRNAAGLGADCVLLDEATCDPLYRKAIRVSAGGALLVPFARFSDGRALRQQLSVAGIRSLALTPSPEASPLQSAVADHQQRWAIWLGTEGPGLDATTLAECDARLAIPMVPGFDSLNVAVACGIALYALNAG